ADRANDPEFLARNWDRRAFEFSRAHIQLVIQFLFIEKLALFQIDQQIGRAIAQVTASHIVLQNDQRVRRIGQIVQQDFDAGIWQRFSNQPNDVDIVFEEFGRIVGNFLAIVLIEQLRVDFLLGRLELAPNIILLTYKNQLPRCCPVFVFEKIMHSEPEILWTEFAKVLASDREWIEIVLFQVSAEFAALFFVFPPKKAHGEKEERDNYRRDDVNAELALQSFNHGRALIPRQKSQIAIIVIRHQSESSSQARQGDVFQGEVVRSRQCIGDSTGNFLGRDHFFTWPFAFDFIPNVGVSRGRINGDHANRTV